MDSKKPTPPSVASAQRASDDVRVAFARLSRRLRDVASESELTPAQVSVLARIDKAEAPTASSLAAMEAVRPQSMAATIASLEGLGFVTRTPDPDDGRRQIVSLSRAGRERNSTLRQVRGEQLTQLMQDRLTEAERMLLIQAMAFIERLARE